MGMIQTFFQDLFKSKKGQVRSLLSTAYKNDLPLRLILPNHDRLTTALVCRLISFARRGIILELNKMLVPDSLNEEICTLYIKLEPQYLPRSFIQPGKMPQTGFMCNSKIVSTDVDVERQVTLLHVLFPQNYIVRDLRRYERVRPIPKSVHTLALWDQDATPTTLQALGEPPYVSREQGHPQLEMLDISAGGAKLLLQNVNDIRAAALTGSEAFLIFLVVLRMALKPKPLTVLVRARCLECVHDIKHSTAQVRLCFEKQAIVGTKGRLDWCHIKDGVPQLALWVAHDHAIFTSKKNTSGG